MLARLQKLLVLGLLAGSTAWAVILTRLGHPGWGAAAALMILLSYALFLGLEFVALYLVQAPGPAPRARAGQLLRAWWAEIITAPRVFFWRQPFRSGTEPDHVPDQAGGRRGVVLVHGFVCNRGLWNPWMRELRARNTPYIAVNLEPLFNSIDHYPQIIETAVARLESITGAPVVLVGHSMGGLAIRAWLRQLHADERVHRVITIGSPHQGTWLARYGHTINGKEMRQHGPWLTALAAAEPVTRSTRFTCFYGHCDNIVFPAVAGTLPGADNRHVPGTAHVQMAFQPVVFNEVWRWVSSPPASAPIAQADLVMAAR
ncbi:MAG: alpha/beta fold hydrolase [Burkholderiales bacterium]